MERFRNHFVGHSAAFVLIGGAASDLVMQQAGVPFRATKDLDIVLCIEALDDSFAKAFWKFVKEGGYQNRQRTTDRKVFYRFSHPKDKNFPYMLELFSKNPGLTIADDSDLTPIPVSEDVSSLSAILLDDDYYEFLHEYKNEIDSVPVVTETGLIPLKAKAWLDLNNRREAGEKIDSKRVKVQKNDVFRLFQLLAPDLKVKLPASIAKDMRKFLAAMSEEPDDVLKSLGLAGVTIGEILGSLEQIYQLADS